MTGPAGPKGDPGPKGDTGSPGPPGDKGDPGDFSALTTYRRIDNIVAIFPEATVMRTVACESGDLALSGTWDVFSPSSDFAIVTSHVDSIQTSNDSWTIGIHNTTSDGTAQAQPGVVCLDKTP